ncbi:zinc finger BED domain-containing protein 3-like [Frankliniella occidentalis]|uniref:Zinc finger BED domain-containing protein 3-like n=1 Tax=Frankliniella occidentalis TaxID=133901 RepID=A0A9C6X9T0_FRAOC|nr:zinc finger BED domain-containing protein 3-like [Frankliniella occidentalis]
MRRSRQRSAVWEHFGPKDGNNRVKCKYCGRLVSAQGGTTTNAKNHLRSWHVDKYLLVAGSDKDTGADSDVDNIAEEQEISTLENETNASSQSASGGSGTSPSPSPTSPSPTPFSPPSSPAPSNSRTPTPTPTKRPSSAASNSSQPTLEAYRCDSKTTERLHFAVTYYIVTSNRPLNTVEKDGFKAMLHAFKPNYKVLSRRTLTDNYVPKCVEQLKSWDLDPKKCAALTSDNASEMRLACELMDIPHMRCIGHTIQNGVEELLKQPTIKPVIKEAKELLNWANGAKKAMIIYESLPRHTKEANI